MVGRIAAGRPAGPSAAPPSPLSSSRVALPRGVSRVCRGVGRVLRRLRLDGQAPRNCFRASLQELLGSPGRRGVDGHGAVRAAALEMRGDRHGLAVVHRVLRGRESQLHADRVSTTVDQALSAAMPTSPAYAARYVVVPTDGVSS